MSEKDTTASSAPKGAPSPMELVLQFHRTYSMPIQPFTSPTLDYERLGMRMSLIAEEFAELMGAVYGPRARAIIEEATAQAVASDEGERDVTWTRCWPRCRLRTCPSSCPTAPSSCARMARCSKAPTFSSRISPVAWAWRSPRTRPMRTKVPYHARS